MKKSAAPLIIGVLLLLFGCIFIGNSVFNFDIEVFFKGWWTLFIIVPAFVSIIANGPHSYNITALIIGIFLLLGKQGIIDFKILGVLIVATIIIGIGVAFIIHYFRKPNEPSFVFNGVNINNNTYKKNGIYYEDTTEYPIYNVVFAENKYKNVATDFKGTKSSAVFGSLVLDLTNICCTSDITIYLTSVFGNIEVYAPKNVKLCFKRTNILGNCDCTAQTLGNETAANTITFDCTSVFGSVEIK